MSEHPNATRFREANERAQREGLQVLAEYMAEDVVWHEIGRAEPRHGLAEVAAAMDGADYEISFETHDVLASDDHVVLIVDATGSRNGRTLDYKVVEVYHVKDGKVTERWALSDDTQAIADFFG
jgi:ketosteroid isomerase-like protein